MEETQNFSGSDVPASEYDIDSHQIDSSNGFEMEPAPGESVEHMMTMGDQTAADNVADSTIPDDGPTYTPVEKEPIPQEEPESAPTPDSSIEIRSSNPFICFGVSVYHSKAVNDLLLWKNIPVTAGVLILFLYTAFSMALMSMLSVIGYYGLGTIICHIAIRLYRTVLDTLGKPHAANFYPIQLLDKISESSWELPQDCVVKAVGKVVDSYNHISGDLRDIIMVRSYARTLKAAALLYFLTWIGSIFNLLTIVIIVVLNMFYIPLVFAKFDKEIAAAIKQMRDQYEKTINIIIQKAPFLAKFLDCKTKTS